MIPEDLIPKYEYDEDSDEEGYVSSALIDINSRSLCLFSSNGEEKKYENLELEAFMDVVNLMRDVLDEDIVHYVDPLTKEEML